MTIQAQFPCEQSTEGAFTRQPDAFQGWVTANNGSFGYPAASGRYHLYVSWACPWAHRTIIVRKLKKLEDVIGMTVVDPIRDERGWAFREQEDDQAAHPILLRPRIPGAQDQRECPSPPPYHSVIWYGR